MSLATRVKEIIAKRYALGRSGNGISEATLQEYLGIDGQGHTILKKKVSADTIANGSFYEDQSTRSLLYKDSGGDVQNINNLNQNSAIYPTINTPATLPDPSTVTPTKKGDIFVGSTGRVYVAYGTSVGQWRAVPNTTVSANADPTGVVPEAVGDIFISATDGVWVAKGISADTDWIQLTA